AGRAAKRPAGRDAPPPARTRYELEDVPDEQGDVRPDSSLNDWYDAREERPEGLEEEDSSVLLRGKSSVSQILSTMMVDKKELDRNLSVKARQRRFFVDVRWGEEKIYSGPLKEQVTILGTDREADIQLKGRYVAGRHSILVRVKDSLLLVRLGSSSATRVNGLPKLQAFLKSGDVIQIDETTITVSED
ncbi:FHA domain-containing protein, partial [Myxococcota bacterium]|nr:FHA domain-containing protein [Myxococcota bacterium]